jgi:FkbM family methyltransferase
MTDNSQLNSVNQNNSPEKFVAHHVGGRDSSASFPNLPMFDKDIVSVIYDADESCLAQVEQKLQGRNVQVYPYCLSDKNGPTKFHINFDPYSSSLFPMNPAYGEYYEKFEGMDYVYKYTFNTKKIIDVDAMSMDYLVENKMVPAPDFLSIDTQGAELPILKGARKTLQSTIVAVMCEVNFVELYKGISLFGELDDFMRSQGFLLATLKPIDKGYKRIPSAYRGKGMPVQGEALYYRDPKFITDSDENARLRLQKLAFASITFGFTELASEALERVAAMSVLHEPKLGYQLFLKELKIELDREAFIPKLWNDTVSFEESLQRFDVNASNGRSRLFKFFFTNRIKHLIRSVIRFFPVSVSKTKMPGKLELFLLKNGLLTAAVEVNHSDHY